MRLDDIRRNVPYRVNRYKAEQAGNRIVAPTNGYGYLKVTWTGRYGTASNGQRALVYSDDAGWTGTVPTRQIETWTSDDDERVKQIAGRQAQRAERLERIEAKKLEIFEMLDFDTPMAEMWNRNVENLAAALIDDRDNFHAILYNKLAGTVNSNWDAMVEELELDNIRQALS